MFKIKHVYVVTGSQNPSNIMDIINILSTYFADKDPNTVILIHGDSRGVDRIASMYAESLGITVKKHKLMRKYGKNAIPTRNRHMLNNKYVEIIAFPDISSSESWDCITQARDKDIKVNIHRLE